MIQKQIQESVSKRAHNPIIINDVNELDDDDNIPNPLEYMESGFGRCNELICHNNIKQVIYKTTQQMMMLN